MAEATIARLSRLLWALPGRLPGKTRLGRMLLHPFLSEMPAVLTDSAGCTYVMPSYSEPIAQHLFTFGAYEPETQRVILEFLSERGTFIDVGANIGALAIPIARLRPRAHIVCIEADPEIHRLLQVNMDRNCCAQVQMACCLVGPCDRALTPFYRAPNEKFGMGSIGPQFGVSPIMLKQRSLDGLAAEMVVQQIDVIKIDVEGSELGVLQGAVRILSSERPPVILFEFADWAETRISDQQPGDAQAFLLAHGYRLFRLTGGNGTREEIVAPVRHGTGMLLARPPHVSVWC
jgi:FkbM family methyltransferase